MTGDERLICNVFREHSFADPVGTYKNHIGRVLNEVERQDGFDGATIASRWPVPIELVDRLESPESRAFDSAFEAATNVFLFLPLYERWKPRCFSDFRPMREQTIQS